MDLILDFFKKAIAALLKLFGYEVDDEFVGNVESAIDDVVNFGKDAAAE
ncbi:MAG: hypothetical protein IJN88_09560 [Clostridia bacterium]|nr:hypothetical protein [Clostridia bacterium]